MLQRLFGEGSMVARLKGGLDESGQAVRGIAHRVANASNPDARFGEALDAATAADRGDEGPVDLESEMVSLADERLRYDAAASLLQKVYQQIRLGVMER